jgi:hypothetical protein
MVAQLGTSVRDLVARVRRPRRAAPATAPSPSPSVAEPCAGCGEETTVGSVRYSDRLAIARRDGTGAWLCSECMARARAAKRGAQPTDADLEVIAENGVMVGAGLLGGH